MDEVDNFMSSSLYYFIGVVFMIIKNKRHNAFIHIRTSIVQHYLPITDCIISQSLTASYLLSDGLIYDLLIIVDVLMF